MSEGFGPAKAFPVVSDVDHQVLVGTAYASDRGDIVITISNKKWKEEVGALLEIDGIMQFMLGCQYKLAERFDDTTYGYRRMRQLFIEFCTKGSRVLVNDPKSEHDGRIGRVQALGYATEHEPLIDVRFESGPGDALGSLTRDQLVIIRDDVDIRMRKVGD